jgi:DNA mismatch repair protein MutL
LNTTVFEPSSAAEQFFKKEPQNTDKETFKGPAPSFDEITVKNVSFQGYAPFSTQRKEQMPAAGNQALKTLEQQETFVLKEETPHLNLIGQYKKTYMLCEQENGLYMIDQHAAHERILYEQLRKRFDNQATTHLLFPEIITVGTNQICMIEPYLSLFQECGIGIELFGSNQLKVHATPVYLKNVPIADIIHETIGWLHEYEKLDAQELKKTLIEKIHAQMACKAAVKAGDTLSFEQMQNLIAELSKADNRFSCPHGRPTSWLLPIGDIEKKFKRDYRSY